MSAPLVFVAHSATWPPQSGDGIHSWEIAAGLAQHGFRVVSHGGDGPAGVEMVSRRRADSVRAARRADILYLRVDGGLAMERLTVLGRLRRNRAAIVWEINGTVDEQIPQGLDRRTMRRWKRARRLLARGADAATVIGPELVGYARDELSIADVTVIENGAAWPCEAAPTSRPDWVGPFIALWNGSSEYPWQAPDTVLETARILAREDPDIKMKVQGVDQGDVSGWTSNLVAQPAGSRPDADAQLRAASVALCLYHDTPWAPNGFYMSPIKLFNAWAAGVPVVATDLGSLRRLVRDGETGLLCADDPSEVAAAIMRLRRDPELRRRLAAAGRAEVSRYYNWDRAAGEVAGTLRRVLARVRA